MLNIDRIKTALQSRFDWQETAPKAEEAPDLYFRIRLRRFVAFVIDFLIMIALSLALLVVGMILVVVTLGLFQWPLYVLLILLPLFYYIPQIGGKRQATIGMRKMGIFVRSWDGEAPKIFQAGLMALLFYVSVGLSYFVIVVVSFFNPRGRCLHDYFSGTVVVNKLV